MTVPELTPEHVRDVSLLLLDVDGVLTDGRLWYGPTGLLGKAFLVRDGFGLVMLHRAGVKTGVISGRDDPFVRTRAAELSMAVIALGVAEKGEAVERALLESGLPASAAAFVGDDTNDLPAMERVGVAIAVADAHPEVLRHVRCVTRANGGAGAVREVADAILAARGVAPARRGGPA